LANYPECQRPRDKRAMEPRDALNTQQDPGPVFHLASATAASGEGLTAIDDVASSTRCHLLARTLA
jgi:hypothetical protein